MLLVYGASQEVRSRFSILAFRRAAVCRSGSKAAFSREGGGHGWRSSISDWRKGLALLLASAAAHLAELV